MNEIDFTKPYNREDFLQFLKNKFLPEDFIEQNEEIALKTSTQQSKYTKKATKLGVCKSLDLVVYEIKHTSINDARVGLSKEAFRFLFNEWENRALVLFVPENSNDNYRFSLITVDLKEGDGKSIKKEYSNPHRYSYYLGIGVGGHTPHKYLIEKNRLIDFNDLKERFSSEVLTKEFYNELSDWYAWAIKIVKFPNDLEDESDDTKYNTESVIRLITRLIFVWFLKQRKLVPNEFFDVDYIQKNLIKDFAPNDYKDNLFFKSNESKYYKAILQNLFFAMLNSPITPEGEQTITERKFKRGRSGFDNNKLMRYYDLFINPNLFLKLANDTVPFLNGGLFECLDDKQKEFYIDGFSDRKKVRNSLIIPDYLFFGEDAGKNIDLSDYYGDKKKKKVSARGIIDILKRYNFTVEENTPFDQEVSLDPELLGKVFENLLASFNPETMETARKQTGSFYTPREIVQFMVDESLVAHLNRTVGACYETEYRKLLRYTDESVDLSGDTKKSIILSLYHCKVLDPACGSGAFPMGMLQQMVHILSRIDPNNEIWKEILMDDAINETAKVYKNASSDERAEAVKDIEHSFDEKLNRPNYARKLYLIENCIFGVDMQPIAIQISKLRFFISLIVDQKINDSPVDNFGIRPLPNLESKFVAANTLLELIKKEGTLFDLDVIREKEDELKDAKHKIFGAKTSGTKVKYKNIVESLRIEISEILKNSGSIGNEEAQQLSSWDMFDQNNYAPFFDPEWMFGVDDGFDIVLGNPPYIQLQKDHGFLAKLYQKCNYKTFAGTGDIYSLFYERGNDLLHEHGNLCYITSNKWMRAGYGKATRNYFIDNTNPKLLIDFAGQKIFEAATVDTNILLFSKEKNENKAKALAVKEKVLNKLSDYVRQKANPCIFSHDESWTILSPIEQQIKKKIEKIGTPLKDWDIRINYGIKTGRNEAFIITGDKRRELIDQDPKSAEIIKPILRGRDIKRYTYKFSDLWLINTHNGIKDKDIPSINIEDYPAIKEHLNKYYSILEKRTDQGNTPYNLRNCAYLEDFSKQKICWKAVGRNLAFGIVESGIFLTAPASFITSNFNNYILGYLCSHYGKFYIFQNSDTTGAGDIMLNIQSLKKMPIPKLSSEKISFLSEKIIKLQYLLKNGLSVFSIEKEIDAFIYNTFGFTNEEIQFIENI